MVVLVLRQGTGLALSTLTLPPGCSQKKVASLMNTRPTTVRCYEVTPNGVRAVDVRAVDASGVEYLWSWNLFFKIENARRYFESRFRPVKPRVAPRMAVGVVVA